MATTLKKAADCLGVSLPLSGTYTQYVKQPKPGEVHYVVASSQSCLMLEHNNSEYVIKATSCPATIDFLLHLQQNPTAGLPEVFDYYPPANPGDLHGFTLKRYSAHIENWSADKSEQKKAADDISSFACNKRHSNAQASIQALDQLSIRFAKQIKLLNLQQALSVIRSFFVNNPSAPYFFELPFADWYLDNGQVVNVDPVGLS